MIEVLKRDLAGETKFAESVQDLDSMRQSILGTVGTMDRFLQAERFRQGKVKPKNTTVDLEALLNTLVTQFGYQAKNKGLNLQAAIPQKVSIQTDPELVLLVLQNILSNAIKYTSRGNVSIAVETGSGPVTRIMVTDQGPGIAPARLDTIFDAFTRGDTHGQGGVGLGLSIARQAADLLAAKLSVRSTVGVGTTFVLELK
jgi:signal transduction histidine kinase